MSMYSCVVGSRPPSWRRSFRLTAAGVAVWGTMVATASAQSAEVDALRREIETLRRTYEEQISALEKRLSELESTAAETRAQAAKAETAAREANAALDEVFDPKFITEGLPARVTQGFETHGYLRAGYGINEEGGGQEEFNIPDGLFEIGWRLGNEKDTYGEFTSVYNFPVKDDGPVFKVQGLLAFKYNGNKTNYTVDENGDILFREAFVEGRNIVATRPELSFWAGQRFYDRHDIHINDFYYLDMSGYGGGFENYDLGWSKLAVAFLGGTLDELVVEDQGSLTENHLDIRFRDIETPLIGGKGMLWVDVARLNGGESADPERELPNDDWGVATGWLQFHPLEKGFNKFSVMYGEGVASDFNTYIADFKPKGAVEESERLLFTNMTVWQFNETTSMMGAIVVDYDDLGFFPEGSSDDARWLYSAGVRPIHMLTEHFGIQAEVGIDYVDAVRFSPEDDDGYLGKITIAPTIRPDGAFWSRPELRVYASYFFWDDNLPNWFGGAGVGPDDTDAWSFGIQTETWW